MQTTLVQPLVTTPDLNLALLQPFQSFNVTKNIQWKKKQTQ